MLTAIVLLVLNIMFPFGDAHFNVGDTLDREYDREQQYDNRPIPPTANPNAE